MSALPKKKCTAEEYAAMERVAEYKSEFYRGEIIPMTGFPYKHNLINSSLIYELGQRLKGGPFQTLSSRMRIAAGELQTYPDLLIVGRNPKFADATRECLLNPLIIVDIRSGTHTDWELQRHLHYRQIESVTEIFLVEQDEPLCERYVRAADGVTWMRTAVEGLDAALVFATVDATFPLRDLYAGVVFPETSLR